MIHPSIQIDQDALAKLCKKYGIRELCIFGSATRGDFTPESDVDLLVEYEAGGKPGFDELGGMFEDLEALFGREIDVVQGRGTLVNPYRRYAILKSLERLYAA